MLGGVQDALQERFVLGIEASELCGRCRVSAAGDELGRLAVHPGVQADDLLEDPWELLGRGRARNRFTLALPSAASRVELDEPAGLGGCRLLGWQFALDRLSMPLRLGGVFWLRQLWDRALVRVWGVPRP